MSKINDITAITSRTLDRYRNSIPRKAFIEAMEAVAAEVVGQSETAPANTAPGIQIIKQPDITAVMQQSCPKRSRIFWICQACPR